MASKRNTALSAEHDADVKKAAAVDAKKKEAKKQAPRASEAAIKRAVELRKKKNLGLVALTRQLTEEGHKSATGKDLRPQTVRQWLMKALDVERLTPEKKEKK